jgi:hypothetical protein
MHARERHLLTLHEMRVTRIFDWRKKTTVVVAIHVHWLKIRPFKQIYPLQCAYCSEV